MKFEAILLAGGTSSRMNENKLLLAVDGESFLDRVISIFDEIDAIERIVLVTNAENDSEFQSKKIVKVFGGQTRTQSVRNGLKAAKAEYVLIHDAARAFVTKDLILNVMKETEKNGSCVPCIPLVDSVREVNCGIITAFPDRNSLFAVQTPQAFNLKNLLLAYDNTEGDFTDDSEVYAKFFPVHTIEGEASNKKITYPSDIFGINAKVGIGYDSHRLEEGRTLVIGGVKIPFIKGFAAHSDGDILTHAVIDALLSAAGEKDIGTIFPDTEDKYKNINSLLLLNETRQILARKNIRINSISVTVIIEKPKLSPYISEMRVNIAKTLGISQEKIAINAKTNEGIGDIGKGLIAAAYAAASVF